MAKKSMSTMRSEMIRDLLAELARQTTITPEIEAKVKAKVVEKIPYQPDELEGFITEVILTREEIIAAAVAIGLIDHTHDAYYEVEEIEESKYASQRVGDVHCTSVVGDNKVARESVARQTNGTDWFKFGAVHLFRPKHIREDKATKAMVDDILGD